MNSRTDKRYAGYYFPMAEESLRPRVERPATNIQPPRFADMKSPGVPFSDVFITAAALITGFVLGALTVYIILSKSVV